MKSRRKRLTKIQQSAEGETCAVRIPGCPPTAENETTVFAHAPCVDKGVSFKSPNWWGAYSCFYCHSILDGRKHDYLSIAEIQTYWHGAIYETQKKLIAKGLITVT